MVIHITKISLLLFRFKAVITKLISLLIQVKQHGKLMLIMKLQQEVTQILLLEVLPTLTYIVSILNIQLKGLMQFYLLYKEAHSFIEQIYLKTLLQES